MVAILQPVDGGYITVIGSHKLSKHKNLVIDELVYFVKGLDMIFLSLAACKNLSLVPESFPNVQCNTDYRTGRKSCS